MTGNSDCGPEQNGQSKKTNRNDIAGICISIFKLGIFLFVLLIYWEAVSSKVNSPYSYYLKGIGACACGIAICILVRGIKNVSKSNVNSFSVNGVKRDRLIREIMVLKAEGDSFDWKNDSNQKAAFDKKLKSACQLACQYEFEESWGNYSTAEYLLVSAIDDAPKLKERAKLILIESEKIKSDWRVRQIKALLGPDIDRVYPINRDTLTRAMTIRNDYYLTRSHKMNLHQVNVNILTSAIALILTIVLLLAFSWDLSNLNNEDFYKTILICGLFGALGAGFSFGRTLFSYNPETSRIPEQLLGMTVTLTRFVIGASAAIIILMLLKADFLKKTFPDEIFPYAHFVFSFAAGFSERWVVSVLGSVIK